MTAFEGGHRTRSFINNYPNLKPYVNEGMFHAVDWLPTILNAAVNVPVGKKHLTNSFSDK